MERAERRAVAHKSQTMLPLAYPYPFQTLRECRARLLALALVAGRAIEQVHQGWCCLRAWRLDQHRPCRSRPRQLRHQRRHQHQRRDLRRYPHQRHTPPCADVLPATHLARHSSPHQNRPPRQKTPRQAILFQHRCSCRAQFRYTEPVQGLIRSSLSDTR